MDSEFLNFRVTLLFCIVSKAIFIKIALSPMYAFLWFTSSHLDIGVSMFPVL